MKLSALFFAFCALASMTASGQASVKPSEPTPIIFETDMGNDIDDAFALAVIHGLQTRGECKLIAISVSKENEFAAPYCDLINTFFGRGNIPIGTVKGGATPDDGAYLHKIVEPTPGTGTQFPHKLKSGKEAPNAVAVLRAALQSQKDGSVAIAAVGFSTNLARLLDSPGDKISPLSGRDLVAKKVKLLSVMAGNFVRPDVEYNVANDVPAISKVLAEWPGEIVMSGFEIGLAIMFPIDSLRNDFRYAEPNPLIESLKLYKKGLQEFNTWDLTAALYAIRPDHHYFGLSEAGTMAVDDKKLTTFTAKASGNRRYLTLLPDSIPRVREALADLASIPPPRLLKK